MYVFKIPSQVVFCNIYHVFYEQFVNWYNWALICIYVCVTDIYEDLQFGYPGWAAGVSGHRSVCIGHVAAVCPCSWWQSQLGLEGQRWKIRDARIWWTFRHLLNIGTLAKVTTTNKQNWSCIYISFFSFVALWCWLYLSLMHLCINLCWIEFNPSVSNDTIILAQLYRYIVNLLYL